MDNTRKWIVLTVVSAASILLAVSVTASSWGLPNTPLHTYRMEQASSEMSFSPVSLSNFSYTVEKGYNINYEYCMYGHEFDDVIKAFTVEPTCEQETCHTCNQSTCCSTCNETCISTCCTCVSTCSGTCVNTCNTCVNTCNSTCVSTCDTCVSTCNYTCPATCK